MRFLPNVSPFGALIDPDDEGIAALGRLIADHGPVAFLQADVVVVPPGTEIVTSGAGVQMVAERVDGPTTSIDAVLLTEADAPEMLALATLTKPGPFLARTHVMGDFFGVRENGRLIAMAGERLKPRGYTEVSGVCTHPDGRGRGLAGTLIRHVASRIQARGESAFLHAYASNHAAIALYERLGFRLRCQAALTVLAPIQGPT